MLTDNCKILFDHQTYTYQVDLLATSCRHRRHNLGLLWALYDNYLPIKSKGEIKFKHMAQLF